MALTYLELVNSLLKKFNEVPLTSGDFAQAYGFQDICKEAINDTIRDINQAEWYWPFNYVEGTITTVADQQKYTAETTAKQTDWDSFYLEKDDSINLFGAYLPVYSYDEWNNYHRARDQEYVTGTVRRPEFVFWYPDNNIGVSPVPDQEYTIKYSYFQTSDELSAHDDTTRIPDHFKNVIIEGATWYIYMAQEDGQKATIQWQRYKDRRDGMRSILINKDNRIYSGFKPYRRVIW